MTFTLFTRNEVETLAVGRALGALARAGDVLAINGPLGAGKTRLVRGVAMGIGLEGSVVSSPTYVVVNEYVVAGDEEGASDADDILAGVMERRPRRLFHVDAYRLSGEEDLDSLGWDRVMDPRACAVVAVEWAERIAGALGMEKEGGAGKRVVEPGVCRVRMEPVHGDGEAGAEDPTRWRRVTIDAPGAWRGRAEWRDLMLLAPFLKNPNPPTPPTDPASPSLSGSSVSLDAEAARQPLPRGWARCPITGRPVPPDAETFPFFDERARMADLGRWMSGSYTISREIRPEDEADPDIGG